MNTLSLNRQDISLFFDPVENWSLKACLGPLHRAIALLLSTPPIRSTPLWDSAAVRPKEQTGSDRHGCVLGCYTDFGAPYTQGPLKLSRFPTRISPPPIYGAPDCLLPLVRKLSNTFRKSRRWWCHIEQWYLTTTPTKQVEYQIQFYLEDK